MNLSAVAHSTIPPPKDRKTLRKKKYATDDIIELVQEVVKTNVHETRAFAKYFEPNRKGLKDLFDFVDHSFTYVEDPASSQWVQTPAYIWKTKKGDCKSFTVFISSVLQNMGIDHFIRYVAYGTKNYRHVYPVALLNGKAIPMDVVWKKQERGRFGAEKPFTKKNDFIVEGLYKLGNTGTIDEVAILGQMNNSLAEIEAIGQEIPNVVDDGMGDVTQMSTGELDRLIMADRYRTLAGLTDHGGKAGQYRDAAIAMERGDIAGIGSLQNDPFGRQVQSILAKTAMKTAPAFPPFKVSIPNPIPPQIRGLFSGIKKIIKKVGDAIGSVFKKFVNWIFKGAGKAMGPFFIFRFLQRNRIRSREIRKRLAAQDKSYNFIRRVGKFDDKQLKGIMLNGILEKTGKSPAQIAKETGVPQIGAAPAAAALLPKVLKAIGPVIQVITKIVGIFKRKKEEAGTVDQTTMSDPNLLLEEAELQNPPPKPGNPNSNGSGGGSGVNPLLVAAPFLAYFALQ